MVCTNSSDLAARVRKLRGQGADPRRHYWFDEIGYNYRLTNLACAIGLAQLERFEELRKARETVRSWYDSALRAADLDLIVQHAAPAARPVLWMYGVLLGDAFPMDRDALRRRLSEAGIETRPFFHSLSSLPIYKGCRSDRGCPNARRLGQRGIMLPTHTRISHDDVQRVVSTLASVCRQPAGTQ
jgi:perosamine synthetase